jgi:hypothetical protein
MNKVVYVPTLFTDRGNYETVKVPTGETEKGLFGRERDVMREEEQFVKTGVSDCDVNGKRLAEDVANAVALLNHEGYEVVAITPITTGRHHSEVLREFAHGIEGGLGYGYSFTKGVIITARRVANGPI